MDYSKQYEIFVELQELLLSAVFEGQSTETVTQKVRKANKLLLEVLVERYGVEILMTRTKKLDWIKQLKAIAKIRLVLVAFFKRKLFSEISFIDLKYSIFLVFILILKMVDSIL